MGKKRHPKENSMTKAEAYDRLLELRNTWSDQTKSETNQTKLFRAGESFISEMDAVFVASGNTPPPPPPRIRP